MDGVSAPIPLTEVADDAVDLIRAFRAKGGISFQDVPLAESRANYLASCKANGLPAEEVGGVATYAYPVEGASASIRLYRPRGAHAGDVLPLVVFIHGGGWVLGGLDTHDSLCRHICNATGSALAAIDYRLAPEHKFPVPLNDCRQALQWLASNAEALRIDIRRVVLVGDSAGGSLATVLANEGSRHPGEARIFGQVLLYPVTDLSRETPSYQRVQSGFPLTAGSMRWFGNHYMPAGLDLADLRLSPLLTAERKQPPLFIVTVGHDPLSDEGIAYAAAAARGGTRVEHHHLPRHAHGLFTSAGKIQTGRKLLQLASSFVVGTLS